MRLGTKLAIVLSLIIIIVLSGYGYFHILSRRDILIRKMKVEVRGIGETLRVSLEKISLPREMEYVQDLIDAVEEYEKTLGVIVYHQGKNLTFHSRSLKANLQTFLERIKSTIHEDHSYGEFVLYGKTPVFLYTFPLKDKRGKNIGGVAILQHTSFMEDEIRKAKWNVFVTILVLIGGTVTLVLYVTRKWIALPIAQLLAGIKKMAEGNLDTRIHLKRRNELSDLGQAFNQMAIDLKEAQERILLEAEKKLELERNLRQSEKLATIGQLSSGLAHEIGTPLNIISGRAELLKKKFKDKGDDKKNLDVIVQQTEKITKIIQQLLGFVRKKKPHQTEINVCSLLEATIDFLDHQIRKQGVKVVKETGDNLPMVKGDVDQLQQVFLNLIVNAIQSMPEGGTLRLSTSSKWISKEGIEDSEGQYVEAAVEDTGVGMERRVVENIFNPFFTTKENDNGTGLGLTVSHGIIQDHEGWIDVESEKGKGSTFRVYLPSLPRDNISKEL